MHAVCAALTDESSSIIMIKFLIVKGADINKQDKAGRTAFLMACHYNL